MAMPRGTLMKNPARHEIHSTAAPPTRRPALAPMPAVAAYQATARERCSPSGKLAGRSDGAGGATTAAPMPWMPRAVMSPPAGRCDADEERGGDEDCEAGGEHPAATQQVTE